MGKFQLFMLAKFNVKFKNSFLPVIYPHPPKKKIDQIK